VNSGVYDVTEIIRGEHCCDWNNYRWTVEYMMWLN